ncbi:hypothetical protein ACLHDG_08010 [Sulfurovum sp. CS9]|uniref:hypothetical protein n=1 Tax=Sulfurovum sp. CS9 TaxID=3391146 RepID=UPI0039ED063E
MAIYWYNYCIDSNSYYGCHLFPTDKDASMIREFHRLVLVLSLMAQGVVIAENWGPTDIPQIFDANLETDVSALPHSGHAARTPWAGYFWPTYLDSINNRWDGTAAQSPSERYAAAFGTSNITDAVSQYHGIDSRTGARTCIETSMCDSTKGEVCAKRVGSTLGRCIPTWFGITHAWAPVSIMLPEPKHEVEHNGVTFRVNDIKALVILAYVYTNNRLVGTRCDKAEPELDDYGRPTGIDCRDTNAGTYHILLTNYLGLNRRSFVIGRRLNGQLSNHPIKGYQINKQERVTEQDAIILLNDGQPSTSTSYIFNADAQKFFHVELAVDYIIPTPGDRDGFLGAVIDEFTRTDNYSYILEATADGEIIGGEYIGVSKVNHPDFLWLPISRRDAPIAGGVIDSNNVMNLYAQSVSQKEKQVSGAVLKSADK